jgi:hypothetical protein
MAKGYLAEIKESDPEKLQRIVAMAVQTKKQKSIVRKTFQDIYDGLLSVTVVLKDHNNNIVKDANNKPIEITNKELIALRTINSLTTKPRMQDVKELTEIIGEVKKTQEVTINFINIAEEISNDKIE